MLFQSNDSPYFVKKAIISHVRRSLLRSASPVLLPYLSRRREVLRTALQGLLSSGAADDAAASQLREDIAFYEEQIRKGNAQS